MDTIRFFSDSVFNTFLSIAQNDILVENFYFDTPPVLFFFCLSLACLVELSFHGRILVRQLSDGQFFGVLVC